ncbi:hypothetical protein AQUSIP_16640 [Aquicella siphonis]|uniref:Uncharacterized protein n=1 Tax=Aquicella siphonis TaxID=254247 RepID=A0A5E4PIW1_9COXI|nr:hypothetical protein [Aquicella siphonis]VVC76353.1 hypothetical protein AQUSIP_16640 [Aquicella siphonis]
MAMTLEQQLEIEFRTRKTREKDFDMDALLRVVNAGCDKLRKGERFGDADEALQFLRHYAVVRDIALAAHLGEHMQNEYGITPRQLQECRSLHGEIEKSHREVHRDPALFHAVAAVLRREDFESLFEKFAPSSRPVDHPHQG